MNSHELPSLKSIHLVRSYSSSVSQELALTEIPMPWWTFVVLLKGMTRKCYCYFPSNTPITQNTHTGKYHYVFGRAGGYWIEHEDAYHVNTYVGGASPSSPSSWYIRWMWVCRSVETPAQLISSCSPTVDEGLTYARTTNTTYPQDYANAGLPWFSFFPFANWETFPIYPPISPVQKALIETITLAQPLAPQSGQAFIDFANLGQMQ